MKDMDRITVDPEVCLGQPTIRGMRITVSVILKQIAAGMTPEDIMKAYPELERRGHYTGTKICRLAFIGKGETHSIKRSRWCMSLSFC